MNTKNNIPALCALPYRHIGETDKPLHGVAGVLCMKQIPLTKGYFAQVSDEDYDRVSKFKWTVKEGSTTNYAKRHQRGVGTISLHRFILGITDRSVVVDHKDKNGLNCQRDNIRIASYSQNNTHRAKIKNATSKYIGVSLCAKASVFTAQIRINKKPVYLGSFPKTPCGELLAALQYDKAAINAYGEFASLNFKEPITIKLKS